MVLNLENLLEHLKEVSEEKHYQGVCLVGVSEGLSEWHYGYSEGLDYAIEKLELLLKK